ncbi:coiled-coil domain-containing protein [Glacieibacterium frigidum]|uniref:Uncharacterized protein n=1 Tax=Glacieibacterium frigidum TaxID=2593303 RepID=A0A552UI40_9SPHN|nr:hypothetical protein [Glacieibacterium frigidum]TRW17896.1 hypothetical protein FMM06_07150 [Glacieibacterium frigidum]
MSDSTVTPGRRWPIVLLTIGALLWLAAMASVVAGALPGMRALSTPQLMIAAGALVLQVLPPLAVTILALGWLVRTRPASARALQAVEARHDAARAASDALARDAVKLDDMLDRIAERFTVLRDAAAAEATKLSASLATLDASAVRLTAAADAARAGGTTLTAVLPDAADRIDGLSAALATTAAETTRQLAEVETLLAAVWTTSDDATRRHDGAAEAATARLAALSTAADGVAARVGTQTEALQRAVAAAFDGTTAALTTTREGVEAQTAALLASVDQARVGIDHIGGEAGRVIGERVKQLLGLATALGERLAAQEGQANRFADSAAREFGVLDAKLANAAASAGATLDRLSERLAAVREAVHALGDPLGETGTAVGEIEAGLARLEAASGAVLASLGTDLPATGDGVGVLGERVAAVRANLDALAAPVAASDAATARIVAQLGDARRDAEGVETATGTAALTASQQLIEVLTRVREVAAVTAGTMRETLGGVVAEAEAALADAGTTRARTAFAEPVAGEIAALTAASERAAAAAQGAAERVTQRLLALTQTIATVEARIDEVDTRYDVTLRDDLAKRSQGLLESLQSGAIDLTSLLSIDVGDEAWRAYLKGDRGIFARRAVRLLDRGTARKIERHFEHDAVFREQATRFITEFETLLARVRADREGAALAVTLVSSDLGKLYVVLAQATERLR